MAAVAAIGSLLYSGYSAVAANQKSQEAKGRASTLLDEQQKATAAADAKMSAAASAAAGVQRKRAGAAQHPSILTSPQGAPPAPTQRKTLLGL